MKQNKLLILCGFTFLSCFETIATNPSMTGNYILGEIGGEATLEIRLTNSSALRDFQFDLCLPEGISIMKDSYDNYVVDVNKEFAPYHMGIANYDAGLYKIVVAAPQDAPIISDGNILFSLPLILDVSAGIYNYEFSRVYASQDIEGTISNVPISDFGGIINIETPLDVEDMQVYNKTILLDNNGNVKKLAVWLKNSMSVKSFSFDVIFPDGIIPTLDDSYDYVEYGERIPDGFNIASVLNGQVLSVNSDSTLNSELIAGNQVIIYINVKTYASEGIYPVKYVNQKIVLFDGNELESPDFEGYIVVGDYGSTGINFVPSKDDSERCYDLLGRPAQKPKTGIYIINGNKIHVN